MKTKIIIERILKLENRRTDQKRAEFPDNDDDFISALGVDPEMFAVKTGDCCGFDYLSALESTAQADWNDYI